MGEFDTSVAVAAARAGVGPNVSGDNCRPNFHLKSVRMDAESEAKGRDVYRDFEYVEIIIPGQRRSTIDRKVREEDKHRWPQAYAAFKANREMPLEGTPLEKWTLASPADVENMKFMNVRTVETLAALTDSQCQECGMGARKLRGLAQEWLTQANGNAGISQLSAKNEALEIRVSELERQLEDALKQNRKLKAKAEAEEDDEETPAPKRRGKKAVAETPEHELS